MDQDNFYFKLVGSKGTFEVEMIKGELTINDVVYQFDKDDPTYAMACAVAKLQGLLD